MLGNLERHKEQQQQQQKQAEDEQNLKAVLQLANTEPKQSAPVEPIEPLDIEVNYSVVFAKTFDKAETDELQTQRKRVMETIDDLSRYNHPCLVKYVGLQVHEEKEEKKQVKQVKKENKQVDKKTTQQVSKKDPPTQQKAKTIKDEAPPPPQSRFKLNLLMEAGVQKFEANKFRRQIKNKGQFSEALQLAGDIVQAIAFLNDSEYTIYPATLEEILVVKQSRLKLAFHLCSLWRTISQQQISNAKAKEAAKFKKQSMLNLSLRYTSPEFTIKSISIKDVRYNDIWKAGIMVLTLLSGEDLSKDLLALQSVDEAKLKEFRLLDEGKMGKLRKYMRNEEVSEILKMVALQPSERPPLRSFLPLFKKLKEDLSEQVTPQTLKLAQEYYLKERNSKSFKFQPQLKPNQELLTLDHKKKISEYFKTNQGRIPKEYRLIYRASQTLFSCKSFYQVAYERRGLLIAIQEKGGKRLICFSQEAFDLGRCVGVFGGWVRDAKKFSFIYSPQQNEFCKLKNGDRAVGVSHIQGPIIGDGDLLISDGGLYNISRFPTSYQSLKLKRLLKSERFQLQEYDVYQVLF